MFHNFSIILQSLGTDPSFGLLSILLYGQPRQQSPEFCKFFFFFLLTVITSSRLAEMKCLYFKIPEEFMRLIFQDGFWVVFLLLLLLSFVSLLIFLASFQR